MTRRLRRSLDMMLGRLPPAMQVAALCVDPASGQVLLITSRGTGRWIIPKGWPMRGRTLSDAAAREAWEEAGVSGTIEKTELGRYPYDKAQPGGFATPVEVRVFLLRVDGMADAFPEAGQRRLAWFDPAEAARLVDEPGLKSILAQLTHASAA